MIYPFTDANHNGIADPGELGGRITPSKGSTRPIRQHRLAKPDASNLKNTKTDEFMVGVDHQILPELVAGVLVYPSAPNDSSTIVYRCHRLRLRARSARSNLPGVRSAGPSDRKHGQLLRLHRAGRFHRRSRSCQQSRLHDQLQRRGGAADETAFQPLDGTRFRGYTDWRTSNKGGDSCLASSAGLGVLLEGANQRTDTDSRARVARTASDTSRSLNGSGSKAGCQPELEVAVQHQRPVPASAELQCRGQPLWTPGLSRGSTARMSPAVTWADPSDRAR